MNQKDNFYRFVSTDLIQPVLVTTALESESASNIDHSFKSESISFKVLVSDRNRRPRTGGCRALVSILSIQSVLPIKKSSMPAESYVKPAL